MNKNCQQEDIHGQYNELLQKNQNVVIFYVSFVYNPNTLQN